MSIASVTVLGIIPTILPTRYCVATTFRHSGNQGHGVRTQNDEHWPAAAKLHGSVGIWIGASGFGTGI